MFGSLVIVYPVSHTGGALVLRHGDSEWTFNSAEVLATQQESTLAYVAFFGDVEHEVQEVTSGYRVTVTYNLYNTRASVSRGPARSSAFAQELTTTMQKLLDDPTFLPKGGTLGFCLAHQYAVERERVTGRQEIYDVPLLLKGSDATVIDVCRALGLRVIYRVVVETTAEIDLGGRESWTDVDVHVLLDWIPDLSDEFALEDGLYQYLIGEGGRAVLPAQYAEHFKSGIDIKWVVPPEEGARFKTNYAAYGNEPTSDFKYTNLCVLVPIGSFEGERRKAKGTSGSGEEEEG